MAACLPTVSETTRGFMPSDGFLINRSVDGYTYANDIIQAGAYRLNYNEISNLPSNTGLLVVYISGSGVQRTVIQIMFVANANTVYIRQRWTTASNFRSWRTI